MIRYITDFVYALSSMIVRSFDALMSPADHTKGRSVARFSCLQNICCNTSVTPEIILRALMLKRDGCVPTRISRVFGSGHDDMYRGNKDNDKRATKSISCSYKRLIQYVVFHAVPFRFVDDDQFRARMHLMSIRGCWSKSRRSSIKKKRISDKIYLSKKYPSSYFALFCVHW